MKEKESIKKSASEKSKPLEFSCRRPVAVPKPQRQGLIKRAEEVEDPRFNREVSGNFNAEKFGKAYDFLDDYRQSEKQAISTSLTSKKLSESQREELAKSLTRMESQDAARKRISMEFEIRKELREKELEMVAKTGKKAYFHPRSVVKKIMHERKEGDLKAKGQLERYRAKQEKRKAGDEKKSFGIPKTRRIVEA